MMGDDLDFRCDASIIVTQGDGKIGIHAGQIGDSKERMDALGELVLSGDFTPYKVAQLSDADLDRLLSVDFIVRYTTIPNEHISRIRVHIVNLLHVYLAAIAERAKRATG